MPLTAWVGGSWLVRIAASTVGFLPALYMTWTLAPMQLIHLQELLASREFWKFLAM